MSPGEAKRDEADKDMQKDRDSGFPQEGKRYPVELAGEQCVRLSSPIGLRDRSSLVGTLPFFNKKVEAIGEPEAVHQLKVPSRTRMPP